MKANKVIFNRDGSRQILHQALEEAEERLIIISPWLTTTGTNDKVISLFEKLLLRDVFIDIGWGILGDLGEIDINALTQGEIVKKMKNIKEKWKYEALDELEKLQNKFPYNFRLKLLNTHEKYLVCDSKFAMVGSHNLLTSDARNNIRETGIYITDNNIIEDLISSFDNAHDFSYLNDVGLNDIGFEDVELEAIGYYSFDSRMSYEEYLDAFGYSE